MNYIQQRLKIIIFLNFKKTTNQTILQNIPTHNTIKSIRTNYSKKSASCSNPTETITHQKSPKTQTTIKQTQKNHPKTQLQQSICTTDHCELDCIAAPNSTVRERSNSVTRAWICTCIYK